MRLCVCVCVFVFWQHTFLFLVPRFSFLFSPPSILRIPPEGPGKGLTHWHLSLPPSLSLALFSTFFSAPSPSSLLPYLSLTFSSLSSLSFTLLSLSPFSLSLVLPFLLSLFLPFFPAANEAGRSDVCHICARPRVWSVSVSPRRKTAETRRIRMTHEMMLYGGRTKYVCVRERNRERDWPSERKRERNRESTDGITPPLT